MESYKNEDGDNSSMAVVLKILEFQQENDDKPVSGTSYRYKFHFKLFKILLFFSSHFIDVQLKSLLSKEVEFSIELFARLVDMCVDENVCRHIYCNYQELIAKVITHLDTTENVNEILPIYTSYFLRIIAKLLYSQVDLEGKIKRES